MREIAGDKMMTNDELSAFFDRHYAMVRSVVKATLSNPADREEVVQEVFLDAYLHYDQFNPLRGTERNWLWTIAARRAYKRLKKLRDDEPICDFDFSAQTDPSAKVDVGKLLLKLTQKQRLVIEKIFFEDKNPSEVAAEIGESYGNVRHWLYRGLQRLRVVAELRRGGQNVRQY